MSYKILVNWSREDFEKDVISHIEDGWELVGSPFIFRNINWCQAVTKVDNTIGEKK